MADDYGGPERGPSFEEMNFRSALEGMGHELVCFDFMARQRAVGQAAMNDGLIATAGEASPDLVFFVLYEEEIPPDTLRRVGRAAGAPTMNWFADDHWRFDDFSRRYAPALDWVITTDHEAVSKYAAAGHEGVILSQWACNRYSYGRRSQLTEHEVTFVGQPHGNLRHLADAGIAVECWGNGWPNGRLDHEDMVCVFSTSRINLNLSNSSTPPSSIRARLGAIARGVDRSPRRSQIKGRTFEVPGSGGFLLTDRVPHLDEYFEPDREIAVYDDEPELAARIQYWLDHEDERAAIADAGYRRTLAEHTYDHRFERIFEGAGLG